MREWRATATGTSMWGYVVLARRHPAPTALSKATLCAAETMATSNLAEFGDTGYRATCPRMTHDLDVEEDDDIIGKSKWPRVRSC